MSNRRAAAVAVRSHLARLAPIDLWTLLYAGVVSVALGWRWSDQPSMPWLLLFGHALLVCLALLAPAVREAGPVGRTLGDWYPIIIVSALYTEIGVLNIAGARVNDPVVQRWEAAVFSMQPSYAWIRAQPYPWLSWLMHVGYFAYYPVIFGAPLALWLTGRRSGMRSTVLAIMVTYYLCYTVFLYFPVAGPRYAFPLAENDATRIPLAVFIQRLLNRADAWGAAFPSSHVAACVAASVTAARAWTLLAWPLAPLTLLLALGTVYGQFHYGVDAVVGALIGIGVILAVAGRADHASLPPPAGAATGRRGTLTNRPALLARWRSH